jgi:hypothetical protein
MIVFGCLIIFQDVDASISLNWKTDCLSNYKLMLLLQRYNESIYNSLLANVVDFNVPVELVVLLGHGHSL